MLSHEILLRFYTAALYLTLVFSILNLCDAAHAFGIVTSTLDPTSNGSTEIPPDLRDDTLGRIKLGLAAAFFFGVILACGIPILLIDWIQKRDTPISYGPSGCDEIVTGNSRNGRIHRGPVTTIPIGSTHNMISVDSDTDSPSGLTPSSQSTDMWPNGISRGRHHRQQQQRQEKVKQSHHAQEERQRQTKLSINSEPLSTPNESPNLVDAEHADLLTGALVSTAGDWPHSRRHHTMNASEARRTTKLSARVRRSTINVLRSSAARKMLLRRWFSRLNCFAAGIFLSSGFMELYVDVEESIEMVKSQLHVNSEFPFAPFLTLVGFFFVLSVEQIIWTVRLSRQSQSKTIVARSLPRSPRPSVTSVRETDLPPTCGDGCVLRPEKFDESVESPQTAMSPLNSSTHFTFTDEVVMPCVPHARATGPAAFDCESGDLFSPTESQPIPRSQLPPDYNHSNCQSQHHYQQEQQQNYHAFISPDHLCRIHNRRLPSAPYASVHNHYQYAHSSPTSPSPPRHHQHSHLPDADSLTSFGALLQVVVLLCAMSVHSLFEGLAVGLQSTVHHTLSLFSAILLHKLIIAAGIGVNLATATTHDGAGDGFDDNDDDSTRRTPASPTVPSALNRRVVAYQSLATLIFAGSSPLGVLIGWALLRDAPQSGTLLMSTAILQGLACGTFFFVVFCELLPTEFREGVGDRLGKLLFLILGFLMVALYSFFMPH